MAWLDLQILSNSVEDVEVSRNAESGGGSM